MIVPPPRAAQADRDADQVVVLHGLSWSEYEILLAIRGDGSVPRMTYLEGELALKSPSRSHEWIKTTLARLIEAWATERRLPLAGFGSWTVKSARRERGLEPDECYALSERDDRPDLAIEVVWSHPLDEKLEVYRGLGIPELWVWQDGTIRAHVLGEDGYREVERSELLPDAPLEAFARFLDTADQPRAVFGFLDWLREQG